jgi:hypothetical protein
MMSWLQGHHAILAATTAWAVASLGLSLFWLYKGDENEETSNGNGGGRPGHCCDGK